MQAELENGYTRVANELLAGLAMLDLSGREFRLLVAIIRQTYGFQKKEDWVALSQFAEITGIAKENISRLISGLEKKRIIVRTGSGYIKRIGINTEVTEWFTGKEIVESDKEESPKEKGGEQAIASEDGKENVGNDKLLNPTNCQKRQHGLSNPTTGVVKSDNEGLSNPTTTKEKKEIITKEIITKEKREADFLELWSVFDARFGDKGSKKKAFAEFEKIKPDDALVATMIRAAQDQKADKGRKADIGQFAPNFKHVERWLKNEEWENEISHGINRVVPIRQSKSDQNDEAIRRFLGAEDPDGRDVDGVIEHEACEFLGRQH